MERILESLEFKTNNKEDLEYIEIKLNNHLTGIEKSIKNILKLNNTEITEIQCKWANILNPFVLSSQYLDYNISIWKDKYHRSNKNTIVIAIHKKHSTEVYLKYTLYNKIERISLRDLIILSELNQKKYKNEDKNEYTLDKFNNISNIELLTFNKGLEEIRIIIDFGE